MEKERVMRNEGVSMLTQKTSLTVEKKTNAVPAPYELRNAQFRALML